MKWAQILLWGLTMSSGESLGAEFSFEYAQHAGYGGLPVRMLVAGTRATLIRQDALEGGAPIGVFRAAITAAQQKQLMELTPDAVDSPVAPARDAGYFVIRLRAGARTADLRIAHDPRATEKVRPLLHEIERLETSLAWQPVRAIALELTPGFAVRFRNIGTEPVHLSFGTLGLTIESIAAEEPPKVPGVTPPARVWELATGQATLPPGIEIAAGESADLRLPLGPTSKAKLYRARFFARGTTDPDQPELFGTATSKPVQGAR